MSVLVLFPIAKEIRLSWSVKLIARLISWNWVMAAAFYVVLHSSWAREEPVTQIVLLVIILKQITEFVLFVIVLV